LICFSFISAAAHVKQNAETNSKVGVACQAGLAAALMVGLAATRLPACLPACLGGSKAGEPIAPLLLEALKPSCVPDLEQPVINLILPLW